MVTIAAWVLPCLKQQHILHKERGMVCVAYWSFLQTRGKLQDCLIVQLMLWPAAITILSWGVPRYLYKEAENIWVGFCFVSAGDILMQVRLRGSLWECLVLERQLVVLNWFCIFPMPVIKLDLRGRMNWFVSWVIFSVPSSCRPRYHHRRMCAEKTKGSLNPWILMYLSFIFLTSR